MCTSFKLFFSVLTEIFDLEEIHNDRIKLTAKTVDEDPAGYKRWISRKEI